MDQRSNPRAQLALALILKRRRGGPISGRTLDVSSGGMRVTTDRPLSIDELLAFDLVVDGADRHLEGQVRVLRQQGLRQYGLRFEDVDAAAVELLTGVVDRTG
jgi:c-di-GMP-binding flagellar brake protein YcgR